MQNQESWQQKSAIIATLLMPLSLFPRITKQHSYETKLKCVQNNFFCKTFRQYFDLRQKFASNYGATLEISFCI